MKRGNFSENHGKNFAAAVNVVSLGEPGESPADLVSNYMESLFYNPQKKVPFSFVFSFVSHSFLENSSRLIYS